MSSSRNNSLDADEAFLGPNTWRTSSSTGSRTSRRTSLSVLQRMVSRRRSSTAKVLDTEGSLGLNLQSCPSDPLLDLIFIHGLGGGSSRSWSLHEDPTLFWPKLWLPREPGFQNVRVHTYGYDSQFSSTKSSSFIDVHDFGQQLLERLRNHPEIGGKCETPIIFVVHSMGGLVAKQAYVLAQQDPSSREFAKRIFGIIFLGTPHRGSNLAETLNNILRLSAAHTTRGYISNLSQQNDLLFHLNDAFGRCSMGLSLYSFYESRPMNLYVRNEVVVPRESAVMGHPNERNSMLDADHRGVCKFESPGDSNYTTVLNAVRGMTEAALSSCAATNIEETWRVMQRIETYLCMPTVPDSDLKDLEEARMDGSCEWFADRDAFQNWLDPESKKDSMVYWISANPATGKSVLSGYVINAVTNLNLDCNYCFIRHGDKDRSTVSGILRSLLYQMALRSPDVRQQILSMIDKSLRFDKDDGKIVWHKLVWPILTTRTPMTLNYWVIDALDECPQFEMLLSMIGSLEPNCRMRILVTSRKVPEIERKFTELSRDTRSIEVCSEEILFEDTKADIKLYLEGNRHKFHVGDDTQRNAFITDILDKSDGCFLWVVLVMNELALAWSIKEVRRILKEVPRGMDSLYSRAISLMTSKPQSNRVLIHAILMWIICAVRPLTVPELREALRLDSDLEIPEVEMAIQSLCAQLVHVDKTGRVMIVHLTAKTFLMDEKLDSEFRIDSKLGHQRIAASCLRLLCSEDMKVRHGRRAKRKQNLLQKRSPFSSYVCVEFAEHLRHTTSGIPTTSSLLYKFLEDNVLSWIEFVAISGNLSVLTRTANSINSYVQRHIQSSSPLGEFVHLTQNWAIDLHRIVAAFGPNLLSCPSAIYYLIPPFCPKSSAIATVAASRFKRITVEGLKDEGWNDRISSIDLNERQVSAIACGETFFAVGCSDGAIVLYHNSTCLPWQTFSHEGPIRRLIFNRSSTHLIAAGRRDVEIWDVEKGFVQWSSTVSHDIMNLAISEDGKAMIAADKSNNLTTWNMKSGALERVINWNEAMPFREDLAFRRPPLTAAFSPDSSLVAIVYRGRPICLYDLDDDLPHGLVSREGNPETQGLGAMTSPSSLVFNTQKDRHTLVAAYEDGDLCLFDYEDLKVLKTIEEANAHIVACSPDGLTLLTGNSAGMVQLMEFETLQLLYRVNADDYGIRDLSFSADNLRFVDVRNSQCNVWEPAVLSGLAKRDDSLTEPAEWEPVIKGMSNEDVDVSCIELQGDEPYFFVGRSDGSLSVHETKSKGLVRVLYRHGYQIPILSACWGSSMHVIASSDAACRFIACVLERDEPGWSIKTKLIDERADSVVLQLLLNESNKLLLVSTELSNSVWNLETGELLDSKPWQQLPASFTWLNHPTRANQRILVTPNAVAMVTWDTSESLSSIVLPQDRQAQSQEREIGRVQCVKRALVVAQGRYLAIELSLFNEQRSTIRTVILEILSGTSIAVSLTQSRDLGQLVRHIVGGYYTKLLFLDADRWVSSMDMSINSSKHYIRHFPLPSEWQSQQRRLQMAVTPSGDVLFVRTNEVAVISHGLDFEERVQIPQNTVA